MVGAEISERQLVTIMEPRKDDGVAAIPMLAAAFFEPRPESLTGAVTWANRAWAVANDTGIVDKQIVI
jgi:hypothetical protein